MKEHGIWNFVFSSSATVYGTPTYLPINEDHPVGSGITNPYGRSKFFIEEIIKDLCKAEKVLLYTTFTAAVYLAPVSKKKLSL